jgi:hypothetical protein
MSSEQHDDTYEADLKLTGKKRQYIETQLVDKNGEYDYLANPNEYKKARKR